jgi:ribosomal protein L11 methylase PrmA
MSDGPHAASFRDPSGFLFHHQGTLFRQVNRSYGSDYDLLKESGLYDLLTGKGLLIPHREASLDLARGDEAVKILEPEPVAFISYPYEWCFSQLKDAALATLRIQRLALKKGMCLKDASAYNIQFHQGDPVLIDTLSFTAYQEGAPWVAYRQFCQHFLAPLALMARCDIRLGALLRTNIDGVPLDLASRLLPWKTRLNPGLLMHIHAHARSQTKHQDSQKTARTTKVGKNALLGIIDSLKATVTKLKWRPGGTEWGEYYDDTNYSDAALLAKKEHVAAMLDRTDSRVVWDVGANNGFFSQVASDRGMFTLAADIDPTAVERNWRACRKGARPFMLPLVMDLTNPSPGLGWGHEERDAFLNRGPADTVIALALIHHLAISNNVPLDRLADFFAQAGKHLIIEFVPKNDSQVQRLLATREDVFPTYDQAGFEQAFAGCFEIIDQIDIEGSERTLYLMRRK